MAGTTLVAGFFVVISTWVFIRAPERTIGPSALELVLPGLASAVTIALGTFFWGARRRIDVSAAGMETTPVLFGFPLGKPTHIGPIAPAFAVSPDDGPVRHVLMATPSGPVSVVADGDGAERLLSRAPQAAPAERPQAELPLATSAHYRGPDRPARLRS